MLTKMKRFLQNTAGSVVPTTAILMIPLMMSAAVAVDYSLYSNMRNDIQTSLDAAGLATITYLGSTEFKVPDNITSPSAIAQYRKTEAERYATNFFEVNIGSNITKKNYALDVVLARNGQNEETVSIKSEFKYDSLFGQIHRGGASNFYVDKLSEELESIITLGNRTIEVALVMDNSGSMNTFSNGKRRIDNMRTAAADLVDDLFDSAAGASLRDPVQFSLVPFSGTVNVGGLGHENLAGDFIDTNGFSPINNENLDWDDTFRTNKAIRFPNNNHVVTIDGAFKSRLDVFNMIGTTWAGCVEMRPYPHNTQDTVARNASNFSSVRGDGPEALFVPYFAPDEPDNSYSFSPRFRFNFFDSDFYRNSYLNDFRDSNRQRLYTNNRRNDPAYQVRGNTRQIERTNWMFKYQANVRTRNDSSFVGPNAGCTTKPITALTTERSEIESGIDDMVANGSTNIQQGLTWGWRTLSEKLPFDQGRALSDRINLKFIILLTDGNNFYSEDSGRTPNESGYGAWGYARNRNHFLKHAITENVSYHNRMSDGLRSSDLSGTIYAGTSFDPTPDSNADFERIMNAHTAQSCENIKNDGISIYTIAYDLGGTALNNPTKALMEACSGSGVIENSEVIAGVQFYHDAAGTRLEDTFAEIASSISAVRISK